MFLNKRPIIIPRAPAGPPEPPEEPDPLYCAECEHAVCNTANEVWFCELDYDAYMADDVPDVSTRDIAAWYAATWVLDNCKSDRDEAMACERFEEQK